MSAPKTIYTDGEINLAGCIFAGKYKTEDAIHEYRLVNPNEQSKIERIRAEVMRSVIPLHEMNNCLSDGDVARDVLAEHIIETIDRISNENDVAVNGGDS